MGLLFRVKEKWGKELLILPVRGAGESGDKVFLFLNGHKTKCRSHPSQSLPVCRWTYWSPQSQNDLPRVTHLAGSKSRVTPQVSYSRAPLTAEILRMQQHNPNSKTISLLSHWTSYSTKCFSYFSQTPQKTNNQESNMCWVSPLTLLFM